MKYIRFANIINFDAGKSRRINIYHRVFLVFFPIVTLKWFWLVLVQTFFWLELQYNERLLTKNTDFNMILFILRTMFKHGLRAKSSSRGKFHREDTMDSTTTRLKPLWLLTMQDHLKALVQTIAEKNWTN
jgi:hypothetical protein